jgi:F-type H+-transporting ATPase subunit a
MGPHGTWFDFLPGYEAMKHGLQEPLGRGWTWEVFQATHFEVTHILFALVVLGFLAVGAAAYKSAVSGEGDAALLPAPRFNLRALFEGVGDMVFGLLDGVMGEKNTRKYLPFLGSFFVFILFSNLISLIPGFRAPTDTLKTNVALSILIFLATHVLGIKEHGWHYLEQFTGHLPLKSPLVILVPLMFVIELISHLIRPLTLAIRLMANMFADHTVALVFFTLVPVLLPVPFLVMGVFVSVVQALVFTLLSAVYISMAVAHEEH